MVKEMFKIKIADTVVEIHNIYSFVETLCKDYIYNGDDSDIIVKSTQDMIEEERLVSTEEQSNDPYLENICVYRQIALELIKRDAFVMHAATVGIGNRAYAFTAKSGTGKSTHIALWKRLLGDKVYAINGDKPIIKIIDGKAYAYGSPWCGKEFWNSNVKAELNGICFLERGEENSIEKLDISEAASKIMKQILIPKDAEGVIKTFDLVDQMLRATNLWKLKCNISMEAAQLSYKTMHGGIYED